jgi:hypothetical protein
VAMMRSQRGSSVLLDDLYRLEMGHWLVDKEPEHHERKARTGPSTNPTFPKYHDHDCATMPKLRPGSRVRGRECATFGFRGAPDRTEYDVPRSVCRCECVENRVAEPQSGAPDRT